MSWFQWERNSVAASRKDPETSGNPPSPQKDYTASKCTWDRVRAVSCVVLLPHLFYCQLLARFAGETPVGADVHSQHAQTKEVGQVCADVVAGSSTAAVVCVVIQAWGMCALCGGYWGYCTHLPGSGTAGQASCRAPTTKRRRHRLLFHHHCPPTSSWLAAAAAASWGRQRPIEGRRQSPPPPAPASLLPLLLLLHGVL